MVTYGGIFRDSSSVTSFSVREAAESMYYYKIRLFFNPTALMILAMCLVLRKGLGVVNIWKPSRSRGFGRTSEEF